LIRGNLSKYPIKLVEAAIEVNEADEDAINEIDEQGFSINETNLVVEFSIVLVKTLPGVPMDELQEQMMVDYAIYLSCKDAVSTDATSSTLSNTILTVKTLPEKVELLEVTDMSFYYSPRAIEAFNTKKESVEAIFTILV
jgi:hypothetical protein